MLDPEKARAASRLLVSHWDNGTRLDAIPEALRPRTRAERYAVQSHVMDRSAAPLFGWKIAATSLAGQRHINVDGPMAGRLLAEKAVEVGGAVSLATSRMRVAEIEFAFRFGREIRPRAEPYEITEVMDAVATVHPAIEIPDSRYDDFCAVGAPQLIADNACANLFVIGEAVEDDWRNVDLAKHPVAAFVAGKSRHDGTGAAVLGDPHIALQWIVNELSGLGIALQPGQVVITGTCVTPISVEPGDEVAGDLGRFGRVSVRFV
ncbi:hydratase [Mesorhizobium sp. M1C.F.Ca.ET.193.01.1.1]|uniref:2-keto-4-pentenoate hydratase n=1 Tax=unclassified Mesorhizobium TaxID=325217 RepID=UPI000FD5AB2D|nr:MULTISPECIES: fumarylacetoacetate hydrolase family protein [unclassified Mesorhizobium]TGS95808.1 hydratase [bacterium M00.F.Ca.ET.177.01.1.1]TGQ51875.1 hydratase [Mesorhizobium sp. M1C.F.Ca.ET.210.01.1.1]TGQ68119.1 hydratase [Mesorhizobium sp. M1C.F.Ca.ET.212.01.1.1]TGR03398.1 hydratase [Mesorhizobium sp. M1C.F.Ca.ET.204.01.1.1]TGR24015.1 hydratase [Mesorhizobium sp. M1C.F.Ca.ET.196.01.1.1]